MHRERFLVVLALVAAWPGTAAAGGLELLPGGTRSVGRGGAVAARPMDPMVMLHNPAGLTELSGEQVMLHIDTPIHSMCVDPYGFYGWGVYEAGTSEFGDQLEVDDPDDPTIGATYATTPLPEVCNSAPVVPIPHMAWATRLGDFALGIGFVAPTVVAGLQYGGDDGTIDIDGEAFPTPTRYQMIKQQVEFALAPSFGFAYRLMPELSLGVNLQIAMLRAKTWAIQNTVAGTQPSNDMLAELEAEDFFLPAITASVYVQPTDAIDLVAAFRWVDQFDGPGKVSFETNTFHQNADEGPIPFQNDPIKLDRIQVGLPYALTLGARYSGQLPRFEDDTPGPGDPMDTELWDIELDATYNFNEQAAANKVDVGEAVTVITREVGGGGDSASVPLADLSQVSIERHALDSIAVRLGGSYAVMPRQLALSAGLFYESRGVEPEYINIDSFALARVGAGIGAMWRIGSVDLTAAVGQIFQEELDLAPPPHQNLEDLDEDDPQSGFDQRVGGTFSGGVRQGGVVLEDPDAPDPSDADAVAALQARAGIATAARPNRIVNAGLYTANFTIISLGIVYRYD